jgi:hypothetical protein
MNERATTYLIGWMLCSVLVSMLLLNAISRI